MVLRDVPRNQECGSHGAEYERHLPGKTGEMRTSHVDDEGRDLDD